MSSKENNEVAVEKIENDKSAVDAKCELNGTKRAAEDNREKVKEARKEENGSGSEGKEFDQKEELSKEDEELEDEDFEFLEGEDFKFLEGKDDAEVDVELLKKGNDKSAADAKYELNGTKRAAEDNTEKVKKARKEENKAGSEGEELYEGGKGEEDEEEKELSKQDDEELEGEDGDEDVELLKKGNPLSKISPDGSAPCCHCAPPNNAVLCRGLTVEGLLSKATFPCRYKEFGCTANVQFNNSVNHEDRCIHRPFSCASLPHTSCSWKGSVSQVTDHFVEKHSNFVQQEAKIKLRIDQDKEDLLLVKANFGSFLVKYAFNSTTCSLSYQIRLCMVDVADQNCKLQLFNDFDPDYNVNLKVTCFAYNTDLCNDILLDVDLKSLLAVLNNPENVMVLFHVKIQTSITDSCLNNEIDYKLLDSIRCGQCHCFLVPPVFDLEKEIICGDCSTTSCGIPTANKTLENLLTLLNFPCKWQGCNFIGNGGVIGRHQTECDFRLYICPSPGCEEILKRDCVELHMEETHDYDYFSDEYVHRFTFRAFKHLGSRRNLVTIIDYEIIVININLTGCRKINGYAYYQSYTLTISGINPASKLVGAVYLSHKHCKLQSKFSISSHMDISLSKLPTCFKGDKWISVTIKMKKCLNLY